MLRNMEDLTPNEIRNLMRRMVSAGQDHINADWFNVTDEAWENIYGRLCSIINNLDDSQLIDDNDVEVEYVE